MSHAHKATADHFLTSNLLRPGATMVEELDVGDSLAGPASAPTSISSSLTRDNMTMTDRDHERYS